ncbi:MAG: hypothetical protein P8Y17_00185 [Patescibacteria group bacterium]|jgi:hypothetical protein
MAEEEKEKKEKKEETKETSKKQPTALIAVIAVVIVGILAAGLFYRKGRELITEKILSKSTGSEVNIEGDGEKVSITSDEGTLLVEQGGELPDSFPSDFPVYPNATPTGSWTAAGDDTNGLSVLWETDDSISKVTDYYKEELPKAGWKITLTSEVEDGSTFAFEKGDVSGFMGIAEEDSKTIISLTLGV